ncbi:hypothetical protein Q7P37_001894 [Cladosporium fusiforme]
MMEHNQADMLSEIGLTSPPATEDRSGNDTISRANPFTTPHNSLPNTVPGSRDASTTALHVNAGPPTYFKSRRIKKGEQERPWLKKKDPKEKWAWIIPTIGIAIGLGLMAIQIWFGLQRISKHNYCVVLDETWTGGFNEDIWTKEVEVGGFGNGQFEQTTKTEENAFVRDGLLHIKPTLQDPTLIETNNIINLTKQGICSSHVWSDCVAVTNTTNGTIVNPVKSARISTKSRPIKFGRVEVVAQLPAGDWLWPAIWMLPVTDTYGPWPASGEIDILEARGNNYTYPQGGNNIASSALHWGPDSDADAWWVNNNKRTALHTTYNEAFHTFGLEWTEKYIFSWVDGRLAQVLYVNFDRPFWKKGHFPVGSANGTRYIDPWSQTGRYSTPFDQDFYLILNVAVGGTNGWFEDGVASKPWVDASPTAKKDFWNAQSMWLPTWEKKGEMIVKSVKIWQQQGYNGC